MGNFNVQKEFNQVIFDYVIPDIANAFAKLARDLSNGNFDPLFEDYEDFFDRSSKRTEGCVVCTY